MKNWTNLAPLLFLFLLMLQTHTKKIKIHQYYHQLKQTFHRKGWLRRWIPGVLKTSYQFNQISALERI